MIKYSLRCDQNHQFEGWFRNSDDCEAQIHDGYLECPFCGSRAVSKSLMAPRVSGTRSQNRSQTQPTLQAEPQEKTSQASPAPVADGAGANAPVPVTNDGAAIDPKALQDMLRSYRKHVVESSDYVGDKFAEEARKMHFKESEARGIYGEATIDDVKSLAEDGIECLPLPVLPEDQN
ncbi:DUF1178 family protein [Cohaesibacter sp. CAU 1516]|uniref:DUF1178 family protein n=1 Tax=Cohaesibacter sp. CAU 1516 TaxID=2576038 RepID=UPI0010FE9164|nr:DUF1178 family protein [Cohaesibacter sp. CAU 1516]TLP42609.1 DUF1178 family protein [Cohaesibacter sp. CAU 1516]